MLKLKPILRRGVALSMTFVFVGGLIPVSSYADGSSAPTCTPPPVTQAGVHRPVGADADTYTYNCATGLWENDYYSYNPATGLTTPKYSIVYTYNANTGLYDWTNWVFSAPTNSYVPQTQSVAQPPAGAAVIGGPAPVIPPSSGTSTGTGTNAADNSSTGTGSSASESGISNTGADSTNGLSTNGANTLTLNNLNTAQVINLLGQQAVTGDASVVANTAGGNATSGDATNTAMVANLLQSTSNALGGNMVTFVANINGNVNGDLLLDPASLNAVQNTGDSSTNTTNSNLNNNLTVNNSTNGAITNNLNLAANSGNAIVSQNTAGGNATSGDAHNIADVINMIDSSLVAGKSFIGEININGNLNGNIVIPPNFVDELLAANVPTVTLTGPSSTNSSTSNTNNNVNLNNTANQSITNNVNATAATGNATVSENTKAGNAVSGNASNSTITAFNLTGSRVIGANDLLVFVNVAGGQWVGLILNAPAGTTAAEFGGGISSTGPNSTNSTNGTLNNNVDVNNAANESITNNITASAQSGNATVSENTAGGNARSGNASNAINLINSEGNTFDLSGWFGILVINVFGTWNGNFGVEPSPGDFVGGAVTPPVSAPNGGQNKGTGLVSAGMRVFGFVSQNGNNAGSSSGSTTSGDSSSTTGAVLAAQHGGGGGTSIASTQVGRRDLRLPIGIVVLFLLYLMADRFYSIRQRQAKAASEVAAKIQAQAL